MPLIRHKDGRARCAWCGDDALYMSYHDTEWGVPEFDSRALFEKLILDGFQAGLSWITILRKRENFRKAFHAFDPHRIARYTQKDVERLMNNEGIIRNRAKITGTIASARAWIALEESEGFSNFIWSFVDGKPLHNRLQPGKASPTLSPESVALAKALKKKGFSFCGPTIVYAFMQAVGMVNDHVKGCHRHGKS